MLEATKGIAGFGETVVHVFGDRGVIGAEVCKLLHRVEWVAVDGDLGWALHCVWKILVKDLCPLYADGQTEYLSSLCEVVNHCLESVLCMCQKRTVVGEEQLKDQLLGRLGSGEEATEIEDTSIGSEPDVDAFGQFFHSLSQHHAVEDGKECRGQHAALFHAISNGEGVQKVAVMFDLNLLAFVELLNDGKELWWAS